MKRLAMLVAVMGGFGLLAARPVAEPPLTVVVMDPLALPLSCPCVKGHGQRDYEVLAKHLERKTGKPVKIAFAESLNSALKKKTDGRADVVIAKHAVVLHDAKGAGMKFSPVASLTGKDGKTTQTGLVVVLNEDPAKTLTDLKGYKILFGEKYAEEKHGAVINMLKSRQFPIPDKVETCITCGVAATTLMDMGKAGEKGAAVISSYAKPILEGCGTVPKGALRVVAETDPVPFIVAFTNDSLAADVKESVTKALMDVKDHADLLSALESKSGFVKLEAAKKK